MSKDLYVIEVGETAKVSGVGVSWVR